MISMAPPPAPPPAPGCDPGAGREIVLSAKGPPLPPPPPTKVVLGLTPVAEPPVAVLPLKVPPFPPAPPLPPPAPSWPPITSVAGETTVPPLEPNVDTPFCAAVLGTALPAPPLPPPRTAVPGVVEPSTPLPAPPLASMIGRMEALPWLSNASALVPWTLMVTPDAILMLLKAKTAMLPAPLWAWVTPVKVGPPLIDMVPVEVSIVTVPLVAVKAPRLVNELGSNWAEAFTPPRARTAAQIAVTITCLLRRAFQIDRFFILF